MIFKFETAESTSENDSTCVLEAPYKAHQIWKPSKLRGSSYIEHCDYSHHYYYTRCQERRFLWAYFVLHNSVNDSRNYWTCSEKHHGVQALWIPMLVTLGIVSFFELQYHDGYKNARPNWYGNTCPCKLAISQHHLRLENQLYCTLNNLHKTFLIVFIPTFACLKVRWFTNVWFFRDLDEAEGYKSAEDYASINKEESRACSFLDY